MWSLKESVLVAFKKKLDLKIVRNFSANNDVLPKDLPKVADVVIIGGGSAGCHTFYHLVKRGIKAVLLERAKITAGTTWHSAGLVWRLRPNDVEIELLSNSRNMLNQLKEESEHDPGWIQNGGIFIAHSKKRIEEYKRLSTIGDALGIENYILDPKDTQKIFPLLDPTAFMGGLYSPGDGVVDPAMLCNSLTKTSTMNGGLFFENCDVKNLIVESKNKVKIIRGVSTSLGSISTDIVVNATGVWGRDLIEKHGSFLPLIPMKHAYIVSESIPGVRGLPNIRDHDYSTYFRIQGDAICMGGYERNPIMLNSIPKDFHFGLYDLDWSVFDSHLKGAMKLCPSYAQYGIKSTICGPESFTPDHKPLMGPDLNIMGLFHNCGFNSAGMMFGGGCGEQMALWIINGKPDLPMFSFDVRRFTQKQCRNTQWIQEKSHESYVKNYSMVFKNDQPLAGRDFIKDPLHKEMVEKNAFMEEKQGWERPGFFFNKNVSTLKYDWYGSYDNINHKNYLYEKVLEADLEYGKYSAHHNLIKEEAMACRNNAVVFNLSYFCKLFLEGTDAENAASWIFSGNTNKKNGKTVYTCILNDHGGVEADVTVSRLLDSSKNSKNNCYYIVAGGASANYTYSIINNEIRKQGFNAHIRDVTEEFGILSVQGPRSRQILQKFIPCNLYDDERFPVHSIFSTTCTDEKGELIELRILRVSFVGELGYELHVPKRNISKIYKLLMSHGLPFGMKNAGYRSLYSLSSEKGYHLWNFDLRSNDTPLEAGLGFTCRKNGNYKGKTAIDQQRLLGLKKRLVYLTTDAPVPIWGLEAVYRNNEPVGFLRRGEYAYTLNKQIGQIYLQHNKNVTINDDFVSSGKYEISILGERYSAECHFKSPFDPLGKRILGIYS